MCDVLLYGVKEDFLSLISKFASCKSYDFNDFLATWNSLEFYYIFSGRPDLEEMKFFMEHALMIAKELVLDKFSSDLEKSGALFLLYMLFVDQPLVNREKIRIECDELVAMTKFANRMKTTHKDIPFAFYSLVQKDAFHYVFSYLKRFAEKTGVVDVRTLSSSKENKALRQFDKPQIIDVFKEIGFNSDSWNRLEAQYSSDIAQIKELDPDLLKDKNNSQPVPFVNMNFLKELQAHFEKMFEVTPSAEKPESKFHRKLRFEEQILLPNDAPNESSEEEPGREMGKVCSSLPCLVDDEEEEEEDVDDPEPSSTKGQSFSMPLIKQENDKDQNNTETSMEED